MASSFLLEVVTPEKRFFEGEVTYFSVRTITGSMGVRAHHTPYLTTLATGELIIELPDGQRRHAALSGGFLKISREKSVIIATVVEWADEIDLDRARRAAEEAQQRIDKAQRDARDKRAEVKLKKALNRIKIAENKK